jgi:L-fuconolactonase
MKIDAHQHYWKLGRDDYGWITPALPVLYRDFLPEDLIGLLAQNSIDKTIVVQAAATTAETVYLLELAQQNESIAGVVGWLDLHAEDFKEQLHHFMKHPKFLGIRIMIQEMQDADEVLQPAVIEAVRYMASFDLPIDLLLRSNQFPSLLNLLDLVPNLRGVIDHIAKPNIAAQEFEPWKSHIKQAAQHPMVYCKCSGMVTEASHQSWRQEDFIPYIQHVLEVFGTKRVMFGSDWPVCLLAANYGQVIEVLQNSLPSGFNEQDYGDLFGHNAAQFYKLQS